MYPPIYRYDGSTHRLFFSLLRRTNGVELNEEDVSISRPIPEGYNQTSVILTPKPSSPLTGQVKLFYNRLSLTHFFFGVPLSLDGLDNITPQTVCQALLLRWSVWIDPVDVLISIEPTRPQHPTRIKIVAKETSLVWVGSIEAWVLPSGYLGRVFKDHELSFNDCPTKQNGFLYSIDRQINDLYEQDVGWLSEGSMIHTRNEDTIHLLDELKRLTDDRWVIHHHESDFNLMGSSVIYHGRWDEYNPNHHVIVLELGVRCKNLFGFILLHYTSTSLSTQITQLNLNGFTHD